jgi:hypothetical protein
MAGERGGEDRSRTTEYRGGVQARSARAVALATGAFVKGPD